MALTRKTPFTDTEFEAARHQVTRINLDKIPGELKNGNAPFFLLWKPQLSDDRCRILKKPALGKNWQKPRNLQTYQQVQDKCTGGLGLGFAYNESHNYICIDVDKLTKQNQELITRLNSYTEVSPSGKGLHTIIKVSDKATLHPVFGRAKHSKPSARDLYISTGYVTITGQAINDPGIREFSSEEIQDILTGYYKTATQTDLKNLPLTETERTERKDARAVVVDAKTEVKKTALAKAKTIRKETRAVKTQAKEDAKEPPSILTAVQVKRYLDMVPVKCLPEDIFARLQNEEPALLDFTCTDEARTPWLIVGQALHNNFSSPFTSLLDGFILWRDWSMRGNKYSQQALEECWESFSEDTENPVTILALIKLCNVQRAKFPDLSAKGALLGTFANFCIYFNFSQFKAKHNEISHRIDLVIPQERCETWALDRVNESSLGSKAQLMMSDLLRLGFSGTQFSNPAVVKYIKLLALENGYNPVRDYFTDCGDTWDGKDRLPELFNTLSLTNYNVLKPEQINTIHEFLRRWLIQVTAAACRSNVKFENQDQTFNQVLIFVGGQGIGKTRWVQSLFPKQLHEYCLGSKDLKFSNFRTDHVKTVMELTNTLICNINEIDRQFTAKTAADFKSFLDTDEDVMVLPYGHEVTHQIRRTVFIGSTNESHFLTDPTGNRRVELIHCDGLNPIHGINMEQLWGQIFRAYTEGIPWWFDDKNPDDQPYIIERDRLNQVAMKTANSTFVEYLAEIYDSSLPRKLWKKQTFITIRDRVGQYAAQDSSGGLRNQFRSEKQNLINWLKQFSSVISEKANKPGSRVYYYMPPIRESLAGEDFFATPDFEVQQRNKSSARYLKKQRKKGGKPDV